MAKVEPRFSATYSYAEVARRAYAACLERLSDISTLGTVSGCTPDEDYDRQYRLGEATRLHRENCTLTVVFAALALEAYAYDYAARGISDTFARQKDRLTLKKKWRLFPERIAGKELDSATIQLVADLSGARNKLVHYKSRIIDPDADLTPHSIRGRDADLLSSAKAAIAALDQLAMELELLDPSEPARFFLAAAADAG